ncbi:MAG: NAD(P)H-hydrate dehydratase [Oscillospiraceae bacterium]|nr:NAD(P)H-hydrate dehydratase [Oscillospiraceae bacterium]
MYVTPQQMKQLEELTDRSGVSYGEMMSRAGHALAETIMERYPEKRCVLFLAGNGNNGGDCYVAARILGQKGWRPEILSPLGKPHTYIANTALELARQEGIPIYEEAYDFLFGEPEIVVDGLFGTGFRGELSPGMRSILARTEGKIRIACDIPSGGNALTGSVSEGSVPADLTVTFGAVKLGMTQYPLRSFCGEILTADIGIPADAFATLRPAGIRALDQAYLAEHPLTPYAPDAYKQKNGEILAVTGSKRMRGAAVLAVTAAMRSGAGMVTCAAPESVLSAVMNRTPEALCLPMEDDIDGFTLCEENKNALLASLPGKDVLLIGCGLGVTDETTELVKFLLQESRCTVILDADGLNAVSGCIDCIPKGRTILTPHPGEAARLLGTDTAAVQADRQNAALTLAERTGATVILKGAGTIVTDGREMAVCTLGNPGMAKAGSGDVLAGITAAIAANQQLSIFDTACLAAAVHAAAGDAAAQSSQRYMLPQDVILHLQEIL